MSQQQMLRFYDKQIIEQEHSIFKEDPDLMELLTSADFLENDTQLHNCVMSQQQMLRFYDKQIIEQEHSIFKEDPDLLELLTSADFLEDVPSSGNSRNHLTENYNFRDNAYNFIKNDLNNDNMQLQTNKIAYYDPCDIDVLSSEDMLDSFFNTRKKLKIYNIPMNFESFILYRNSALNKGDLRELKYLANNYYDSECVFLTKYRIGMKGSIRLSNRALYNIWEIMLQIAPDVIISAFKVTERFIKGDHKFLRWEYQECGTVLDIAPYEAYFDELGKQQVKDRDYESFIKLKSRLRPNNVIEFFSSGMNSVVVNMKTNKIVKSVSLQSQVRLRVKSL